MSNTSITNAELFIASGCLHCPVVLKKLTDELKSGKLASLKVTNIAVNNERAEELNVRSVPWFSLSNSNAFMIFAGEHSPKEIQQWLVTSLSRNGMQDYIEEYLKNGQLMTVIQAIQFKPEMFSHVITMIASEETNMDLRIGLDVLIEHFAESNVLKNHVEELKTIASSEMTRLRIDALHYIALSGDIKNKPFLQNISADTDKQVKQAALEAIETLNDLVKN